MGRGRTGPPVRGVDRTTSHESQVLLLTFDGRHNHADRFPESAGIRLPQRGRQLQVHTVMAESDADSTPHDHATPPPRVLSTNGPPLPSPTGPKTTPKAPRRRPRTRRSRPRRGTRRGAIRALRNGSEGSAGRPSDGSRNGRNESATRRPGGHPGGPRDIPTRTRPRGRGVPETRRKRAPRGCPPTRTTHASAGATNRTNDAPPRARRPGPRSHRRRPPGPARTASHAMRGPARGLQLGPTRGHGPNGR